MLVADLLSIFGVDTPRALEYIVDDHTFHMEDAGVVRYPGRWRKIARGLHLPDDDRMARVAAFHAEATRVRELPLWNVLNEPPLGDNDYQRLLSILSPEVRRFFVGSSHEGKRQTPNITGRARQALMRISSLDALTALLITCRQAVNIGKRPLLFAHGARAVFLRLAAFPPLYDVRSSLYAYLNKHFFTLNFGSFNLLPADGCDLESNVRNVRGLLRQFGQLGLAGPTFASQLKVISSIDYYRLMSNIDFVNAFLNAFCARKPYRLDVDDPLWIFLKKIRHPSTRKRAPVFLPWKGQSHADIRFANALEQCTLLSGNQAFTSN